MADSIHGAQKLLIGRRVDPILPSFLRDDAQARRYVFRQFIDRLEVRIFIPDVQLGAEISRFTRRYDIGRELDGRAQIDHPLDLVDGPAFKDSAWVLQGLWP